MLKKSPLFNFKSHCLSNSKELGGDKKQWHHAQTLQIRETILKECQQKIEKIENDTWAIEVNKIILECIDFFASESRYHRDYQTRFLGGKSLLPRNQNVEIAINKCSIILKKPWNYNTNRNNM